MPELKVCGVTSTADLNLLATSGADMAGLWHGVPGGHADLTIGRLTSLAAAAHLVTPVLVTLAAEVRDVLAVSGIRVVQLHGYQAPGVVRALKRDGVHVIKVLHVAGSVCPERPLIRAYERAGVDSFLIDAVGDDGRIGSTGQSLAPAAVLSLAASLSRPFLLAGGITADNAPAFAEVAAHPGFLGVDVDTGARDSLGCIDAGRVRALRRAWDGRVAA
ncbi:N-(5'-phosphoribosyl)anthranilate isomerase [Lentzea tibetensis]|uniref:N-(5'-phosphoribosyl)anthranilate isomerase n=1 Tax=Lentzea tibetensis TaxID=2591470 RepID=A0A563EP25_9PSEU|nr:N-(5'-phosphoribosyl)anthranilate isomerase [Lentzea tibetensis]TWP48433.1 N-(5'-phosphoribosyl)anthranilate isomerase [Lentzea tibetensis]